MYKLTKHINNFPKVVALFTTQENGVMYLARRGYRLNKAQACGNGLIYPSKNGDFYELFPVEQLPIDPE